MAFSFFFRIYRLLGTAVCSVCLCRPFLQIALSFPLADGGAAVGRCSVLCGPAAGGALSGLAVW